MSKFRLAHQGTPGRREKNSTTDETGQRSACQEIGADATTHAGTPGFRPRC